MKTLTKIVCAAIAATVVGLTGCAGKQIPGEWSSGSEWTSAGQQEKQEEQKKPDKTSLEQKTDETPYTTQPANTTTQSAETADKPVRIKCEEIKFKRDDALAKLDLRLDEYFWKTKIRECYILRKDSDPLLQTIAGIYAGTINVTKIEKTCCGIKRIIYFETGEYSEAMPPEAIEKALKNADSNGDFIVTPKELKTLNHKVNKEYEK